MMATSGSTLCGLVLDVFPTFRATDDRTAGNDENIDSLVAGIGTPRVGQRFEVVMKRRQRE
jgi:hypothetical protein